jgi:molybdate transport system substrate-binding protein
MIRPLAAVAVAALAIAGCGSDDGGSGDGGDRPRLVVSAASSMKEALTDCSRDFRGADVRLSFAGSDELAAQIRQGVKPDVYAAANTALPDELHEEGKLSKPVEFVANTLVVAVPRDSRIQGPEQLADDGVTVAIGSETVPIGSYTREVLGRFPGTFGDRILDNVRTNEPDAKGIVGKLTQGAADAGFVYASDVEATDGELRAIPIPGEFQPSVVYAAGIVDGAEQPELAGDYVEGLVSGRCYDALQEAGFGPLK